MEHVKKKSKLFLWVSIVLLVVSMLGVHLVQTGGDSVEITRINFKTQLGYSMHGLLFVPENATAETPAPAIITVHGMFNNLGMQDLNFIELSRRGYVVFAIDMFSHGRSEPVAATPSILQSVNQAVEKIAGISYVDTSRIGVTGFSLGGMSTNVAVGIDNGRETPLIAAVLINSANATFYDDDGKFINIYGNRHAAIIAPQYEEFFMLDVDVDGNITPPRDFIYYNNAQSFLHFGTHPDGLEHRASNVLHHETIDGEEFIRVVYNPAIIHPGSHFSRQSTYATIEFFEAALGAPNMILPSSQVWQLKVFFNAVGLVGIAIFLVSLVKLMIWLPSFESLRTTELAEPKPMTKGALLWFFGSLLASALFAMLTYFPILRATDAFRHSSETFRQTQVYGIALWALASGIFTIVSMLVYYHVFGKKNGFNLKEMGIVLSKEQIGKTLLLAVSAVAAFYAWVFVADFFFFADFRLWIFAITPFTASQFMYSLVPYMLFFVVFFVANSVATSTFNYNTVGGKKWVNTLIVCAFNVAPVAVLIALQYTTLFTTGFVFFGDHAQASQGPYHMFTVWLFPFIITLTVAPIISRKVYRVTRNPYLAGIIIGIIVTLMATANTLTWS